MSVSQKPKGKRKGESAGTEASAHLAQDVLGMSAAACYEHTRASIAATLPLLPRVLDAGALAADTLEPLACPVVLRCTSVPGVSAPDDCACVVEPAPPLPQAGQSGQVPCAWEPDAFWERELAETRARRAYNSAGAATTPVDARMGEGAADDAFCRGTAASSPFAPGGRSADERAAAAAASAAGQAQRALQQRRRAAAALTRSDAFWAAFDRLDCGDYSGKKEEEKEEKEEDFFVDVTVPGLGRGIDMAHARFLAEEADTEATVVQLSREEEAAEEAHAAGVDDAQQRRAILFSAAAGLCVEGDDEDEDEVGEVQKKDKDAESDSQEKEKEKKEEARRKRAERVKEARLCCAGNPLVAEQTPVMSIVNKEIEAEEEMEEMGEMSTEDDKSAAAAQEQQKKGSLLGLSEQDENNDEEEDKEKGEGGEGKGDELDRLLAEFDRLESDELPVGKAAVLSGPRETQWAVLDEQDMSNFHELVPEPVIEYPFELDDFQKRAVYHLERRESVFVAAHTSAGKTVVAEYAIALAATHMTRAVYTSPIKALSNQKYRDFKETFDDVGLVTGDVSINPEASCLIVTTEILRSMLYRGADLIRDVEWVIFDEVHYVNDRERGVVWEEVIIMLPEHVNVIMLSATVPNALEFADWIGRTKRKKIYVIATSHRPVPLEYDIYAGDALHKIVGQERVFLTAGYQSALAAVKRSTAQEQQQQQQQQQHQRGQRQPSRGRGGNSGTNWPKLVKFLKSKELLPTVVFVFSKKQCEATANSLKGVSVLDDHTERDAIKRFVDGCLLQLKPGDRTLPQLRRVGDLLRRGIGVHHGGLLPIVKEMVEILFARGLLRILFATETFAMGVNTPTRSVVFSRLRKYDSSGFRDLQPGEFTQMAGRAGRRGKDAVGVVVVPCEHEVPEAAVLNGIMLGTPTVLQSKFRLTYSMILNLLRIEDFRVEDMMKRSFAESREQREQPRLQRLLQQGQAQLAQLEQDQRRRLEHGWCIADIEDTVTSASATGGGDTEGAGPAACPITEYGATVFEHERVERSMRSYVLNCQQGLALLQPGRVVVVVQSAAAHFPERTLGAVVRTGLAPSGAVTATCVVYSPDTRAIAAHTLTSAAIAAITKARIALTDSVLLRGPFGAQQVRSVTRDLEALYDECFRGGGSGTGNGKKKKGKGGSGGNGGGGKCAEYSPFQDLKIRDVAFMELADREQALRAGLARSPCHRCPRVAEHLAAERRRAGLAARVARLRYRLSDASLQHMPEFEARVAVLKALGYLAADGAVAVKGRVAREISTVHELVATEWVLQSLLSGLPAPEFCALLSTLVCQEHGDACPVGALREPLRSLYRAGAAVARQVAACERAHGLPVDPDDFVAETMRPHLMEVVYEWAHQVPFRDICRLTLVPEGSVVRYILRLDEACKDIRNAARTIGDPLLFQLAEHASALIRRDIVFAASLYYADDAKLAAAAASKAGATAPDVGSEDDSDGSVPPEEGDDDTEAEAEADGADDGADAEEDSEDSEDEMTLS